jgi:hypothetical protein
LAVALRILREEREPRNGRGKFCVFVITRSWIEWCCLQCPTVIHPDDGFGSSRRRVLRTMVQPHPDQESNLPIYIQLWWEEAVRSRSLRRSQITPVHVSAEVRA